MTNRITVDKLSHSYGTHCVLNNVSFSVSCGETLAFLGPNGSGKTTLFKILSTLMTPTSGNVNFLGHNLCNQPTEIRKLLGVVFQQPGLDVKLTVTENLRHHGHLYGLSGKKLKGRISTLLDRFGIIDRAKTLVDELSGGLQRRVEIAKAMLHSPRVLLLDEPSSGLDVGIRRQLNEYLTSLAEIDNILVLLTTHLMDDAELCKRVGILDSGNLVALETPDMLKSKIGGGVVLIESGDNEALRKIIAEKFGVTPIIVENGLRIECQKAHEFVRDVVAAYPDQIQSVRFGKPTLEDVFIKLTGNPFVEGKDK